MRHLLQADSDNTSNTLKTFRLDGTYHSGNDASFTLGYFNTTGSTDMTSLRYDQWQAGQQR